MDDYILKRQKLQIFFPSQKLEVTFERTTKLSALSIPTIRRCHKLYLLSYFLSILHIYLKHLFILFIYLFIYYFPPSTVRRPPSAVHRPPSAILCPPSVSCSFHRVLQIGGFFFTEGYSSRKCHS